MLFFSAFSVIPGSGASAPQAVALPDLESPPRGPIFPVTAEPDQHGEQLGVLRGMEPFLSQGAFTCPQSPPLSSR
jgi:hypothetical protein